MDIRASRIAVTGIGCVAPNGTGSRAAWEAALAARSGIQRVPAFDALDVRIGVPCADFDVDSVLPERERRRVSRTAILAIAASREACAQAGLDPAALDADARAGFGVVLGTGGGAQDFHESQLSHFFGGTMNRASAYAVSASTMGGLSSEVSIALGLHGLSHVVTSGCASSTDAIAHAARLLLDGELDRVLCGGSDAPMMPGVMAGFCLMGVLASGHNDDPARASRPFQRDRSGFVLGEGAWMFVLERESTARARCAEIFAYIEGWGSTCDAQHRVQTTPSGAESTRAINIAMKRAGISAEEIGLLSLHGTGTRMNDATEHAALRAVFGERLPTIAASAPKSLLGHPQGASGAMGVALAIWSMNARTQPPDANQDAPDPELPLALNPGPPRALDARHALCNCLAFGSKNSALIVGRGDQ